MSTPTWKTVSGPPSAPKTAAPRPRPRPQPRQASWPAPSTQPVSTAPPITRVPRPPAKAVQSQNTCLNRAGNDKLTDCGRFLFHAVVKATEDPAEVTCGFCLWRIERGTARVLH